MNMDRNTVREALALDREGCRCEVVTGIGPSSNSPSSLGRSGCTSGNQVDAGEQAGPHRMSATPRSAPHMLESYARCALRSSGLDEVTSSLSWPSSELRAMEHQEVLRSGVADGCKVTVRSAPCSCGVFTSTFSRRSRNTHVSFTPRRHRFVPVSPTRRLRAARCVSHAPLHHYHPHDLTQLRVRLLQHSVE
jgi:hypothetical protein